MRVRCDWAGAFALVAMVLSAGAASGAGSATSCPSFRDASEGLPVVGEWRTHPAVGDVNGDGRVDIAGQPRKGASPKVWLRNGRGWKEASTGLRTPGMTCGVGVDLADFNADGHLDLGVADHCQGIFLYLGDGGKTWRLAQSVMRGSKNGFDDLQFADLDGDGHLDLAAIGSFRGGIATFRGDGKGRFKAWKVVEQGLPDAGYGSDIELVELNGDGVLDVLVAYAGGALRPPPMELRRNFVWLSEGPLRWRPATAGLLEDGRTWGVTAGDVNGDGRPDVALGRSLGHPLMVFLQDEQGGFEPALEGLPEPNTSRFYGVALGDLDADGDLDLIATDHFTSAFRVWLGDGKGAWSECEEDMGLPGERAEGRGWGLRLADLDADGRLDVVAGFGRQGNGALEAWLQKP